MIDYYARVADVMLPHLRGRPTTLKRYPDGVEGFHFFEKRCPKHRPEWVKTATVLADRAGPIDFTLVDNKPDADLARAARRARAAPRSPRPPRIEVPTVLAFDLDPGPPATIIECCRIALRLRDLFASSAWSASRRPPAPRACRSMCP